MGKRQSTGFHQTKTNQVTFLFYSKKTIIWKIVRNASSLTVNNEIWTKSEIKINDRKVPKRTGGKKS